ncbi:hypothetical protein SYNTR_1069 [Candidatus Syntrophocurvum alkaliphilum]|uniref:Uncharacterized protein n=1 Tax=Candidatus Syntrophocurvum alkaliphilum TaxID=2293317 RepID=A0A6I6DFB7_9FIRM|nr:hypothetical protein [Candidatus Syntrophocurvum alkaliphilum]QGT99662.1 hypothetical protein SYNTR_1069 [Candidatus Syntrophocurvum alkaliphilum]
MKTFLNGKEMQFVDGGYEYVFSKPYKRSNSETIEKGNGNKLYIQMYDNGVIIRTLIGEKEVNTLINRNVEIDTKNNKVYILEKDDEVKKHDDGSVEIIKSSTD